MIIVDALEGGRRKNRRRVESAIIIAIPRNLTPRQTPDAAPPAAAGLTCERPRNGRLTRITTFLDVHNESEIYGAVSSAEHREASRDKLQCNRGSIKFRPVFNSPVYS